MGRLGNTGQVADCKNADQKSALWIKQCPDLLKYNTGEKRNGEEIKRGQDERELIAEAELQAKAVKLLQPL